MVPQQIQVKGRSRYNVGVPVYACPTETSSILQNLVGISQRNKSVCITWRVINTCNPRYDMSHDRRSSEQLIIQEMLRQRLIDSLLG